MSASVPGQCTSTRSSSCIEGKHHLVADLVGEAVVAGRGVTGTRNQLQRLHMAMLQLSTSFDNRQTIFGS